MDAGPSSTRVDYMSPSPVGLSSFAWYETILENIRDGVYTLDSEGRITWVNEVAIEEFDIGYARDELVGSHVAKVLTTEDIQKCLEIIQDCLQHDDRDSGRCEVSLQTADGSEIPCDLHLALLPLEDGEFRGTVGVVRDISDRKWREQRLAVLNRVLRHNLRNTMNVILGRAELLASGGIDDRDGNVESIISAGEGLLRLSEKVRRLSDIRTEAGEAPDTVDVADQIRRIIADFRRDYPTVDFGLDFPAATTVRATVGRTEFLDVAVRNLVENAAEHNDSAEPRVTVAIRTVDSSVLVRVEDNGPGIPEHERGVLERELETPLQHSNGIGLWLAYWCVTAAGGDIGFDASSRGSVVTLEFPSA